MTTIFKSVELSIGKKQSPYKDGMSIEIEAEFTDEPNLEKIDPFWRLHKDGSLRGVGYEFISRTPVDKEKLVEKATELVHSSIFNKYSPSHRTSTHIHLNVQNWTLGKLKAFLLLYYLCEPVLTNWAGEHRVGNLFCLQLHEAQEVEKAISLVLKEKWGSLHGSFDNYKYSALNVASIARLGTVEFRQLRGTKDPVVISLWLDKINKLDRVADRYKGDLDLLWSKIIEDPKRMIEFLTDIRDFDNDYWDNNYSLCFNIYNQIKDLEKKRDTSFYRKPMYNFGVTSEEDLDKLE